MRGPTTMPSSIARLSPNAGPPTSRTVVNPRISVSVASAPATQVGVADVPRHRLGAVGRTSIACQCTSIRPGMSVRPPPSMILVVSRRDRWGLAWSRFFSILLPADEHVRRRRELAVLAVEDADVVEQHYGRWRASLLGRGWQAEANHAEIATTTTEFRSAWFTRFFIVMIALRSLPQRGDVMWPGPTGPGMESS